MKAVKIIEPRQVEITEVEMPIVQSGEVLIHIKYVGFCGSDLSSYRGVNPLVNYPVIPGHEVGAVVEAIGEGVPDAIRVGDRVTVNPYTNCGKCASCRRGRGYACEFNQTLGVQRNGAMANFVVVPWQKVIVENSLSLKELALVEPLSVGFHAVDRGRVEAQDTVLVFGCGMIGMGAIIGAAVRGARVIAVDVDDQKLDVAKQYGATHLINSLKEDLSAVLHKLTDNQGADVIIEAVGRPETYVAAIDLVAFTGRVVYIGYAKELIAFQTPLFVKKEIDIMGSRNAQEQDFRAVIAYLKQSPQAEQQLITTVYPVDQAAEAIVSWDKTPGNYLKILVDLEG